MIGFIPLPTNSEETSTSSGSRSLLRDLRGDGNLSIPIVLTLVVWVSYHVEGVRAKGFLPYRRAGCRRASRT